MVVAKRTGAVVKGVSKLAAFVTACGLTGCGNDAKPHVSSATEKEIGKQVSISASPTTAGFPFGRLREQVDVAAFTISKYPVSVEQYGNCVAARVCNTTPDPFCSPPADAASKTPALCVGSENAKSYCTWAGGGALPTLNQWLLAARGTSVSRFAWGDAEPTHKLHPAISEPPADLEPGLSYGAPNTVLADYSLKLGAHSAGASPFGVEDILIAPGELLRATSKGQFAACVGDAANCIVSGALPGAIDAVRPLLTAPRDGTTPEGDANTRPPYAFRCVWEGGN